MTWQFLISLSIILFSISVLLQRFILRESNSKPIAFSIFFQFLTGILITIAGFLFSNMTLPNIVPLIPNLLLMIVLYTFANIFIFKSLKEIEASKYTIIFATRVLFTILASTLILSEGLTIKQLGGALFILLGVIFVSLESTKFTFKKGELFALLGAIGFGFANTNDRFLLSSFNIYPYMSVIFISPAIFMGLIYPKELKYIKLFLHKSIFKKTLLLCIIYALSAATFFGALKIADNSSQVISVNLTSVIVTVLLSIIFLKERTHIVKKLAGAVITFIGLLLIN